MNHPDPRRTPAHDPAHYPARCSLPTRFADMDLWQHLNNAALIGLHGEAVQRWLAETLGPEAWRPVADVPVLALLHGATDFVAESHYPAPIEAGMRLTARDGQGLTLATALFQQGRCVGLHAARLVAWRHGVPVDLPATLLAALPAAEPEQAPIDVPATPSTTLADAPPDRDRMAWHTTLATRFGDTDARGMASDASLARFAEQMRVSFLTEQLGELRHAGSTGFMVGRVALRWWHRGTRPPSAWQAGGRITRVGERSISLQGALFDEAGTCHASADSVLVCIDRHTRRSTPLPEGLRATLGAVEAAAG